MNFPIAVLLLCALIGLADKMIGGRFGLAEEFDRGMTMMGSLAVTMSGVYCFSVMLGRLLSTVLQGVSLPLDPTILVSSVLATDMGAYSIADTLCTDYIQKIFSGVLLSATLGTTISFSLPIALGSIYLCKGKWVKWLHVMLAPFQNGVFLIYVFRVIRWREQNRNQHCNNSSGNLGENKSKNRIAFHRRNKSKLTTKYKS